MNKIYFLLKMFFMGFVTLLSNPSYSFVEFYLLTNNEGNIILILGDYHFEAALDQKDKEHIDLFIKNALESKSNSPIPCVIELDKIFEPAFKGEDLPSGHKLASAVAHLATYASNKIVREKIKLVTYDPRGLDCLLLTETVRWLTQFLPDAQANTLLISQDTWDEVKPKILHTSEGKNYTVQKYLAHLGEKVLLIKNLAEKYDSGSLYVLFKELYSRFVQAKDKVIEYFSKAKPNRPVALAILDTFDGHLESAAFLQKYKEFTATLLNSLDNLYFDICCLDKIFSLYPKGSNKLVLIVGSAHAIALYNYLKKIGYKSILEEVNIAYVDDAGLMVVCSGNLLYLEKALLLFFSSDCIPSELLPTLEQAMNTAAKRFKQIVANTIQEYPNLNLTPEPAKQDIPVASEWTIAQNNSIPTVTIADSHCHNNNCQKKACNTCTRCRKARYCSKECQLADWKAKHKSECKLA